MSSAILAANRVRNHSANWWCATIFTIIACPRRASYSSGLRFKF